MLQLVVGERPACRVALVLNQVHRGVAVMTDLRTDLPEPVSALSDPPVATIE